LYQLGRERRPAPSLSPGSGNLALLGSLRRHMTGF